jgi:hypothetical protein
VHTFEVGSSSKCNIVPQSNAKKERISEITFQQHSAIRAALQSNNRATTQHTAAAQPQR